jgi:hypothetical protein
MTAQRIVSQTGHGIIMQLAKLMDAKGRQIARPVAVPATVSFDARDGIAQAWQDGGTRLHAELHSARVVWIGSGGMRLEGMEPIDPGTRRYRAMAWHVTFSPDNGSC